MTCVTDPTAFDLALGPADYDEEPRGTRLDRWWARQLASPAKRALWNWGGPVVVVIIAALTRLWNLSRPHALVFDETYYVKDAWTITHLGYEGTWPGDPNPDFEAGRVNGYTDQPEFVAHPPLGKWIIGLGELAFGVQNAFGWRVSVALAGILAVVLVMWVAKRLFHSQFIAVFAGLVFAIEGNAIVMSRVGILDNLVMLFALLGFCAIVLDRDWSRRRLARWAARSAPEAADGLGGGPVLWWRPWLFAAGILFGLDAGVKWSGFYFLAVFGCYAVLSDLLLRRRLGIRRWWLGSLVQAVASFVVLVPVALASYIATWTGWIVTSGGYDRHWAEDAAHAWHGALAWVPKWAQSLWHYQTELYNYSINLHAHHDYQSNPLTWPLMLRPTSMYWHVAQPGQEGCMTAGGCTSAITDLANPIIWWVGATALIYLIYRGVRYADGKAGLILAGYGAGWLPWVFLYMDRTIFTFYSIAFEPFMILAIAYAAQHVLGRATDTTYRRTRGIAWVAIFTGVAAAASVFFWSVWTATPTSYFYWQLHMWLPSWI